MIERIIIEGADQQGKTTLGKELAEKLNWNLVHFGKPTKDFDFVQDYMVPKHTICDRNFISETVYAKINERPSRAATHLLSNIFRTGNTLLILMDRGKDFVFDSKRHEDYTEEQIQRAIKLYRESFDKIFLEKITINPNCEDYEEIVQSIIDRVNGNI